MRSREQKQVEAVVEHLQAVLGRELPPGAYFGVYVVLPGEVEGEWCLAFASNQTAVESAGTLAVLADASSQRLDVPIDVRKLDGVGDC